MYTDYIPPAHPALDTFLTAPDMVPVRGLWMHTRASLTADALADLELIARGSLGARRTRKWLDLLTVDALTIHAAEEAAA